MAQTFLAPEKAPEIKIEVAIETRLIDIRAERYDAGVRFGDQIAKDMTAVRISPDIRMVIVASPSYLKNNPSPNTPADLMNHKCINLRFSANSEVYAWELRNGKESLQVRVDGAWTFNGIYPVVEAALAGTGLAYMPEELARPHIQSGRLQYMLRDWGETFPGLYIFFSSRLQLCP